MGLDITVHKLMKISEIENEKSYFYKLSDEDKKRMSDVHCDEFYSSCEQEYYDYAKFFGKENWTDDYEWCSTAYRNGKCIHTYRDKTHVLYPIYKKFDAGFKPDKVTITEDDEKLLRDNGYDGDLIALNNQGEESYYPVHEFVYDKTIVEVDDEEIPTYKQTDYGIYLSRAEYGYQRKGLNRKFYDEFKAGDYFVWTRERLEYIRDNYIDSDETKEYFQNQIIDSFEDGKFVVTFDW